MTFQSRATTVYVEPVRKLVRVNATPARAFEVFTAGMSRWWLPAFSINPTQAPIEQVVIEPKVGGRWYERGTDGSECDWGRVLEWAPPGRVLLAWQISSQWAFNPAIVTELELRFEAESAGVTAVYLEHRKLDQFGADAVEQAGNLAGGWSSLLERYAAAVA